MHADLFKGYSEALLVEEDISKIDIKEGMLVMYLLKPISYFWKKFFEELPAKLLQATYGLLFCLVAIAFLGKNIFTFSHDFSIILLCLLLLAGAMLLSFTLKMILGILTFWFIDIQGLYEMIYLIEVIFSGILMPIVLMPTQIAHIAYILPFAYIVYSPISVLQGHVSLVEIFPILFIQCIWLLIGFLVYQTLWMLGIKKFSGVGQ